MTFTTTRTADPTYFAENRLPAHSDHRWFASAEEAATGRSSYEQCLNGTWRFHLREGVTFSDGSAFGASDVKHSIERTLSDKLTCEIGAKFFGGMKLTATVVDDKTIDITADPAQPILPLLMSTMTIVPEETPMMEFTRSPVGTGPYKLTSYDVGQSIVLDRRDDYWGEKPAVTKATYLFRSDDAVRAAMVATGEADIAPLINQLMHGVK